MGWYGLVASQQMYRCYSSLVPGIDAPLRLEVKARRLDETRREFLDVEKEEVIAKSEWRE